MTEIQQVLFELERPYLGHPYYITGHGLFSALARRVDDRTRRSLQASHGVFVPGDYGSPTEGEISLRGGQKLGTMLPEVEAYEDLFLFRDAAQRWLSESRPRDVTNVHPLQRHGDRVAVADEVLFGKLESKRRDKRAVSWFAQCYLHADEPAALPIDDETLDGIQVGGARNYGLGELSVVDTQLIDLNTLDYSTIEAADAHHLELVSPYVTGSAYPEADDQPVPWWWDPGEREATGDLHRRTERLVNGDDVYELNTIDHGQTVPYAGGDPVQTAWNGITRVGTHSRFGFGELRVRPAGTSRVPEHNGGEH